MAYVTGKAHVIFPGWSLFTVQKQTIFITCLSKVDLPPLLDCTFFSSSIPFMHFLFHRIFSVKTCMRNDSIAYFISFLLSQNLTRFAASCFLDPQEQSALEELWVMCPARLCQAQLREQSHLGWLSTTVKIGYRVEEACKEFSKIQDKCHMSENSDASER